MASPWLHPSELPQVESCPPAQTEAAVRSLLSHQITIYPRAPTKKNALVGISTRLDDVPDLVLIPYKYRVPLMFVLKFKWESLRLVLASADPVAEWKEYYRDILYLDQLCRFLFASAQKARDAPPLESTSKVKGERAGGMDWSWRCATFDRVITRFWHKWLVSREWSVKEFWEQYGEEEYEIDVLQRDWIRWVVKGHKGFKLTKEDVENGLTHEQLTEGLECRDGVWVWESGAPFAADEPSPPPPPPRRPKIPKAPAERTGALGAKRPREEGDSAGPPSKKPRKQAGPKAVPKKQMEMASTTVSAPLPQPSTSTGMPPTQAPYAFAFASASASVSAAPSINKASTSKSDHSSSSEDSSDSDSGSDYRGNWRPSRTGPSTDGSAATARKTRAVRGTSGQAHVKKAHNIKALARRGAHSSFGSSPHSIPMYWGQRGLAGSMASGAPPPPPLAADRTATTGSVASKERRNKYERELELLARQSEDWRAGKKAAPSPFSSVYSWFSDESGLHQELEVSRPAMGLRSRVQDGSEGSVGAGDDGPAVGVEATALDNTTPGDGSETLDPRPASAAPVLVQEVALQAGEAEEEGRVPVMESVEWLERWQRLTEAAFDIPDSSLPVEQESTQEGPKEQVGAEPDAVVDSDSQMQEDPLPAVTTTTATAILPVHMTTQEEPLPTAPSPPSNVEQVVEAPNGVDVDSASRSLPLVTIPTPPSTQNESVPTSPTLPPNVEHAGEVPYDIVPPQAATSTSVHTPAQEESGAVGKEATGWGWGLTKKSVPEPLTLVGSGSQMQEDSMQLATATFVQEEDEAPISPSLSQNSEDVGVDLDYPLQSVSSSPINTTSVQGESTEPTSPTSSEGSVAAGDALVDSDFQMLEYPLATPTIGEGFDVTTTPTPPSPPPKAPEVDVRAMVDQLQVEFGHKVDAAVKHVADVVGGALREQRESLERQNAVALAAAAEEAEVENLTRDVGLGEVDKSARVGLGEMLDGVLAELRATSRRLEAMSGQTRPWGFGEEWEALRRGGGVRVPEVGVWKEEEGVRGELEGVVGMVRGLNEECAKVEGAGRGMYEEVGRLREVWERVEGERAKPVQKEEEDEVVVQTGEIGVQAKVEWPGEEERALVRKHSEVDATMTDIQHIHSGRLSQVSDDDTSEASSSVLLTSLLDELETIKGQIRSTDRRGREQVTRLRYLHSEEMKKLRTGLLAVGRDDSDTGTVSARRDGRAEGDYSDRDVDMDRGRRSSAPQEEGEEGEVREEGRYVEAAEVRELKRRLAVLEGRGRGRSSRLVTAEPTMPW